MDMHTICLIGGTTLYCLLTFYFGISSFSLLYVALVDHVVCFRCAASIDPVVGVSVLEITIIDIRARST